MTASSCRECGGTLRVAADRRLEGPWGGRGVWRFAAALTAVAESSRVSLDEGGTPLLPAQRLSAELGVTLLLKDETRNPTGTFKDRCLAVAASIAVESGAPGLVCASTGNAGASTAAYAAAAGLPSVILVPAGAPSGKLDQAIAYGAQLIEVRGNYSDCYALARAAADRLGYVNATTTFVSPYSVEGSRTVAHELTEQCTPLPEWVVVPIGAGPLLVGIQQAFHDLGGHQAKLLAVQPDGCAPIVQAWAEGADRVIEWGEPETLVGSLADPLTGYAHEGDLTLEAIRASDGAAVAVPDQQTLAAVRDLAAGAGVFAEPGGAIGLAGVRSALQNGIICAGETVVCCVTGTGLKDPRIALAEPDPTVVSTDPSELLALLEVTHAAR